MRKKIIISLIFLVIIAGFLSFWLYKERIFSKEVLKLEILGPDSCQIGEEIEYTLRYKNNGDFTLEQPKLIFELPEYSITEGDQRRIIQNLNDIYPGEESFFQFKARLFGKENDLKVAKASLSYRPKNLSARYESTTTFTTKISSVPLTLEFDLPSQLEAAKETQFSLNYFSNIDYSFPNLTLQVEYPAGFEFSQSDPPALEKTDWKISNLQKAQGGRIKIKGKITGEVGQKLTFKAKLAFWQDGEYVLLKETSQEFSVIQPLIYISQQINNSSNYIASPGEKLHYKIFFRNIGAAPFENQFLLVRLEGHAFDLATLKTDWGELKPEDNLIIWDWKQVPELKFLDIQEEGKVEFDVQLKENWSPSPTEMNNTIIKDKVNISQISEEFQTKVNSKLEIVQKGYYQDQVFGNLGPLPPKVDEKTTYTITWQAKNYYNSVKNVKVRATLPSGVTLSGKISPSDQLSNFSFDSQSREIVWTVKGGEILEAGTGVSSPPPTISFQVELTPMSTQRGQILPIINKATISGEDQWTQNITSTSAPAVNTTLPDDGGISDHRGVVE